MLIQDDTDQRRIHLFLACYSYLGTRNAQIRHPPFDIFERGVHFEKNIYQSISENKFVSANSKKSFL